METLISSHHYVWALKTVSISSNFSTFSKSDLFKVWERYDLIMAFYANSIYGQRMESTWVARGLGGLALSVCKARSTLLLAAPAPYTCLNSPSHWFRTCLKVIPWGRPSHASLLTLHSGSLRKVALVTAPLPAPCLFQGAFLWCDCISTWFLSSHPSAALDAVSGSLLLSEP